MSPHLKRTDEYLRSVERASARTIAQATGTSENAVRGHLVTLQNMGRIEKAGKAPELTGAGRTLMSNVMQFRARPVVPSAEWPESRGIVTAALAARSALDLWAARLPVARCE